MQVTGGLQRQAWTDGVLPPVEEVRRGLWSIPVPIPISTLRYVNVYALRLTEGVALVDAGWDTPEAWEALQTGLAVAGYEVADVRAVLVTHIHPDHYGLAARVRESSGAWVGLHAEDARLLREGYGDADGLRARVQEQLRREGVPAGEAAELGAASMGARHALAEPDVLLGDGEVVPIEGTHLVTVWTPGHSPGHACFHDPERRLLFSGDHVLPRISPNVTVHPRQPGRERPGPADGAPTAPADGSQPVSNGERDPRGRVDAAGSQDRVNPLGDFLDALRTVRRLEVTEVLPAHEYRFSGLAERVDDLIAHHDERLSELAALLIQYPGRPAWELAGRLSWSRPWSEIAGHMRRLALGETLAHLALLAVRGRASDDRGEPRRWYPVW